MDEQEIRVRAMDFAIAARTGPGDDIVELAQRIYDFLATVEMPISGLTLVDQVQADIKPPRLPEGLGRADQTPVLSTRDDYAALAFASTYAPVKAVPMPTGSIRYVSTITGGSPVGVIGDSAITEGSIFDLDNVKTRLVRTHQEAEPS